MVSVKNKVLRNLISFKLGKEDMPITEEEAATIKDIVLDNYEIEDSFELFDTRELEVFPNLETLTLIHFDLDNYDMQVLSRLNLKDITFEDCTFENPVLIANINVESLSLLKNEIADYSFVYIMEPLKELRINKGTFNIQKGKFLKNIVRLDIAYSEVEGDPMSLDYPNLEAITLDHTNINDCSFLLNIPNLKEVSLSEEQFLHNQSTIRALKQRNIKILNEGIVEFTEEGGAS